MDEFFRFPHTPHITWLGSDKPRDDQRPRNDKQLRDEKPKEDKVGSFGALLAQAGIKGSK